MSAIDSLTVPVEYFWQFGRLCDCPIEARHSDDCPWTPIYRQMCLECSLPSPWDWPLEMSYFGEFRQRWILGQENPEK